MCKKGLTQTSMYTDIEKQDYRSKIARNSDKIPEAHVIKDFLDTLEEKGYKLTTDSMIYGGYYEEITRYEQNMANIVPQNLLSGCDWTTKAWTPDTAYASSSHDCTYFETDVDNEDFNHFISVLQNITINT